MTMFDIDSEAVLRTVRRAADTAAGYATDSAAIGAELEELQEILPNSLAVTHALAMFTERVITERLTTIVDQSATTLEQTARSVQAYQDGDGGMAANAKVMATPPMTPVDRLTWPGRSARNDPLGSPWD
jgi:hypothetical protein